MLRTRPIGPTPPEREEHCRTHEPHRAWRHACIAGRGRADLLAMRNESEKGLPVVGDLTVSGRASQSCVDESDEMGGFSPTCFKARVTVKHTSQSSA